MDEPKLRKATIWEWQASLFGACFFFFGLGAIFAAYIPDTISYIVIVLGVVLHGWGMYRTHQRNK